MEMNNLTLANSRSEPNLLATAAFSGFPPGTTVDELWHYRRKKPLLSPIDNLTLLDGSFQLMKTEYTRRFKNYHRSEILDKLKLTREDISPVRAEKPDDSLRVPENNLEVLEQIQNESSEQFVEFPWEKPERRKPAVSSFEIVELVPGNESERLSEFSAKFQQHPVDLSSPHFHKFTKRPTQLKLDPKPFSSTTEQTEKYKEYELGTVQKLVKRPSTLKLEGTMDSKTENRDKFIAFDPQPRPPLCKKTTNLHLEGLQQIHQSENQRQFVQHELLPRPPLTKANTNLHIEGELDFLPEYKKEFVEFKQTERRKLALPVNNLKPDGFYEEALPDNSQFHPQIPFLRGGQEFGGGRSSRRESFMRQTPMESENKSEFVEKSVPKTERYKAGAGNLCLEGAIDMNCEYRSAYIDFNKEKGFSPTKIKSRRVSHQTQQQKNNLKSEGKMEISPEYSSTYVNFPRERPHVRRPECSLSSEGELEHVTEQTEKYIAFPNASRTNSLKRESELKLSDKHFECQPEYRKAYIDYLIRERVDRKHRPIDNLSSLQQKRAVENDSTNTLTVPPPSLPAKKSSAGKDGRNLSQIESSVFGPKLKLTAPSTSSRSSSPAPLQKTRKSKSLPRTRSPESAKRFNQAVRVENLACRASATSPSRRENYLNVSAKNKWMRDSSIESNSAFVVLDKAEINNNTYGPLPHPPRETRWRPSWS